MSPRTRQALIVAVAAVSVAAVGGIAAIQGWLPESLSGEAPANDPRPALRIAGTAPPESLSPGESVVPAPEKAPAPCPQCGTVSSLTFHEREARNARWEVRVRFDDGTRAVLRYPTNPGFRVGERVSLSEGRLRKD